MQVLEDTHSGEVSALRKKLQWFTDNQELQDRDAARLGAAAAEIQQLKEQVRLKRLPDRTDNEIIRLSEEYVTCGLQIFIWPPLKVDCHVCHYSPI